MTEWINRLVNSLSKDEIEGFSQAIHIRADGLTKQMRHYMKTIDDHITSATTVLGSITGQRERAQSSSV